MATKTQRARLGVILPSVNTVVEPWFGAVCPPGVTVHAARMFLDYALTRDALVRMDHDEGMRGVKQIMSCRPASVAYCCTASSIVQGLEYDGKLNHELHQAAGVPAFTATSGIIEALRAVGYDEALALQRGTLSREAAIERTSLRTRQLAKRQRTWFRHQVPAARQDAGSAPLEALLGEARRALDV